MGQVLCVQEDFWLPEHPCVIPELHGWEPPKELSWEGNIPAGPGPVEQPHSRGAARPCVLMGYKLEELCHEKSGGVYFHLLLKRKGWALLFHSSICIINTFSGR